MTALPFILGTGYECRICPEWTLACAHFDGRWLAMHRVGASDTVLEFWSVCTGTGIPREDEDAGEGYHSPDDAEESPTVAALHQTLDAIVRAYPDYDAALAAFREAEQALLRGDL